MKSILDSLTIRCRPIPLVAACAMTTLLFCGCARRAANDWAQNAPLIEPTRGGVSLIGFGAWDDPIEPKSLDAMMPAGMALRR